MGMNYNITFHNAVIPPRRYGKLIGWSYAEVTAEPEKAAALALEAVRELVSTHALEPIQDEEGIDISECGFWDSASYDYGENLTELLRLCEPGAYIHEIDDEESTGEQWRVVLQDDGTIKTVTPIITWPGMGD